MRLKHLLNAAAGIALIAGAQTAQAQTPTEITIGYFLEWPMPFEFAKVNGDFEKAMGVKINWTAFDTGTAMSAAMASGDVQLSISQGVPPMVVATSAGQDLKVVDIALSYNDNDNCVVASGLEITKDNASELAGKKVGVPIGSAAHFGFLKQMEHFGVDVASLQVVDMAPADGAAAFAGGNLDMVCGWGGALRRMKEHGNVLLTGAEKEALGIRIFDVTSGPADFVTENPELIAKFIKVSADMDAKWLTDSAEMLPVIAKDAGMDDTATSETLAGFVLPTIEEKLSQKWLGGDAQAFFKEVADFFVTTGNIPSALDSYDAIVDIGPLKAASEM